jgi:hypothetical protein
MPATLLLYREETFAALGLGRVKCGGWAVSGISNAECRCPEESGRPIPSCGVGADALDHRPHPIGPLRREMLLKTQFAEERPGVGSQDFANGAIRIERKRDGDKAAHQVRVAVAPIMEHPFPGRIRAIANLEPHLADAAANFIRIVVCSLAQGLERPTEFENIAIAILPVVEEGEVAADGVKACQR